MTAPKIFRWTEVAAPPSSGDGAKSIVIAHYPSEKEARRHHCGHHVFREVDVIRIKGKPFVLMPVKYGDEP